MSIHPIAALIGGLGLFLLGMGRLTDGLKIAAGPSLRDLLNLWTRSAGRGLLAGILITAIVQSSSAVTVATVGFVNAGLLSLTQAVWLIFGTNIGTTMTAWLVALIGVKLDVGILALPLIGGGMAIEIMARRHLRVAGLGVALSGFGLFFLGIGILSTGFAGLAERIPVIEGEGPLIIAAGVIIGLILTTLTQSSSAAIAIALTSAASGSVGLLPAAAVVIGTNIGTTSTAGFAALGATAAARRVVLAHVAFNLITGVAAILMLKPLFFVAVTLAGALDPGSAPAPPALILALFHSLFNVLGVLLMWPLARPMVRWLQHRFVAEDQGARPQHLDDNLLAVPSLAFNGLILEIGRMSDMSLALAREAMAGADSATTRKGREDIFALGGAVRGFIGQLSSGDLPASLAAGVADLLRATQHVEETAQLATQIQPSTLPLLLTDEAQKLSAAVMLSLGSEQGAGVDPGEHLDTVENAYQAAKSRLLLETAAGRLSPVAMEAALDQVQTLRRMVEAAIKAQRRFQPWADRVSGMSVG